MSFDAHLMREYLDSLGDDEVRANLFPHEVKPEEDLLFQELANRDFNSTVTDLELDIMDPVVKILLVQTSVGHAQNGHGEFFKHAMENGVPAYVYPHSTIPDIIKAAGLSVQKTKTARRRLIDNVFKWVDSTLEDCFNKNNDEKLLVFDGEPLFGVNFLGDIPVSPRYALKGMVHAAYMDNFQARTGTLEHFEGKAISGEELKIGGGESYLVDPNLLFMAGLDYEFLAKFAHDEGSITYLRDLGVIVPEGSPNAETAFVRRREGPGTSDDLAFIAIGSLYGQTNMKKGVSALLGAFVVDAADTYDKCVIYPAEKRLDEKVGEHIQEKWQEHYGRPLVSQQEIRTVIYLSAKNNSPKINVSSSHRRFVQVKEGKGDKIRPTVLSHIAYLEKGPIGNYRIGFNQVPSKKFYSVTDKRLEHLKDVFHGAK
ncbi:hypothetical protein HOA91_04300 [Candidatus Woesearchaeota archaeon]|nr:hypothetical protein [Candidatus Woesearchaeota archaeon]